MWSRKSGEDRQTSGLENWRQLYWKRGSRPGSRSNSLRGGGGGGPVSALGGRPSRFPGPWLPCSRGRRAEPGLSTPPHPQPGSQRLASFAAGPSYLFRIMENTCSPGLIGKPLHKLWRGVVWDRQGPSNRKPGVRGGDSPSRHLSPSPSLPPILGSETPQSHPVQRLLAQQQ